MTKKNLILELKKEREGDIIKAINGVLRVRIGYNDKKKNKVLNYEKTSLVGPEKGKNERYILPVAYGLTKAGKPAIRAYQSAGSTRRGEPHWKLFLLDNIFSWTNGKKSFKKYRNTLINLGLNTSGDKGMTTIYAITPIADENVEVAKTTSQFPSSPITKNDIEPTNAVQKEKTTDTSKFVPSKIKSNSFVDNSSKKNYTFNKVKSQETRPVTKTDIGTDNKSENETGIETNVGNDNTGKQNIQANVSTEPVTKSDIEGSENKLSSSFKDLTSRMDNLYKDDEDEEEKNEQ